MRQLIFSLRDSLIAVSPLRLHSSNWELVAKVGYFSMVGAGSMVLATLAGKTAIENARTCENPVAQYGDVCNLGIITATSLMATLCGFISIKACCHGLAALKQAIIYQHRQYIDEEENEAFVQELSLLLGANIV